MKALIFIFLSLILGNVCFAQIGEIFIPKYTGNVQRIYIGKYKYVNETNKARFTYLLVYRKVGSFNKDLLKPYELGIGDSVDNVKFVENLELFLQRSDLITDKKGQLLYETNIGDLIIWYKRKGKGFFFTFPSNNTKDVQTAKGVITIEALKYSKNDMIKLIALLKKARTQKV